MANTINVSVDNLVWTEVLSTESTGIISIAGIGQHCVQDSIPDKALIGHRFAGEPVQFTLGSGEKLYVKVDAPTVAIITEY